MVVMLSPLAQSTSQTHSHAPVELELRQRHQHAPRVTIEDNLPYQRKQRRQFKRIIEFQKEWKTIRSDLPPQLTREHSEWVCYGRIDCVLSRSISRYDIHWRCHW